MAQKVNSEEKFKFYMVGGGDAKLLKMIRDKGHSVTATLKDATVVMFTGGEDVCPFLYGETPLPLTHYNIPRDNMENRLFRSLPATTRKVGICRGAQFLNVMTGGSLWQHVTDHTTPHMLRCEMSDKDVFVSSTHHQMMIPSDNAIVLATAKVAMEKHSQSRGNFKYSKQQRESDVASEDVEVAFDYYNNALMFQPHPEYYDDKPLPVTEYFWEVFDTWVAPLLTHKQQAGKTE